MYTVLIINSLNLSDMTCARLGPSGSDMSIRGLTSRHLPPRGSKRKVCNTDRGYLSRHRLEVSGNSCKFGIPNGNLPVKLEAV